MNYLVSAMFNACPFSRIYSLQTVEYELFVKLPSPTADYRD